MISLCFGRQRRKERTEYTLLHYQSFAWSNASSLLLVGGTGGGGGKAVSYLPPTWYLSLGMELAKKNSAPSVVKFLTSEGYTVAAPRRCRRRRRRRKFTW